MKKSILLGAAALAAIALAAPQAADAGEVKIGGYYQFRTVSTDNTVTNVPGDENANYWSQRLQLNIDMKASEKSHAHMIVRPFDGIVEGSDVRTGAAAWDIRQLWLETEAWGVSMKVGNMPIALNDGLLVDNDVLSFGSILLAKNFGGVTLVGANVRVDEGVVAGTGITNAATNVAAVPLVANQNDRDADLYVLSALGKIDAYDYQLTGAYLKAQLNAAAPLTDLSDGWIALTMSTKFQGIDLVGTVIYETGADVPVPAAGTKQFENDGMFVGARAKGAAGFGGWNGYAFYGAADFTSPLLGANEAKWSPAWDSSGTGSQDLMQRALTVGNSNSAGAGGANAGAGQFSNLSNMWGVGGGLAINAGAWTIKPSLDYAHVVEDVDANRAINANIVSAWGGTLGFSTKIQEGTVLDLSGTWVNPKESSAFQTAVNAAGAGLDTMHYIQASVKMDF